MRWKLGKIRRPAIVVALLFCCLHGSEAAAGVSVNMNVNLGPPPVIVSEPPEVVLMPNYGTYFVPGISFDIFFYNGYWWSPRGAHWYRASGYNGPWMVIDRRYVPGPVRHVPHDYRRVYSHERHVPYGQWKREHGGHGGERGHGGGEHRGGGHGGGEHRGGGHGGGGHGGGGHGGGGHGGGRGDGEERGHGEGGHGRY